MSSSVEGAVGGSELGLELGVKMGFSSTAILVVLRALT